MHNKTPNKPSISHIQSIWMYVHWRWRLCMYFEYSYSYNNIVVICFLQAATSKCNESQYKLLYKNLNQTNIRRLVFSLKCVCLCIFYLFALLLTFLLLYQCLWEWTRWFYTMVVITFIAYQYQRCQPTTTVILLIRCWAFFSNKIHNMRKYTHAFVWYVYDLFIWM